MQLTPRIKQILQILLDSAGPLSEQEIANQIGVSKRTVQREFDYMERGLPSYGITLQKKKNIGVWLDGSNQGREVLLQALSAVRHSNVADKEQRIRYLIFELLRERTPKKLFYFSDLFGVSEATISSDLETVEQWLAGSQVQLIRKPGYGIILKGKEKNYRVALQRFIKENINDESTRSILYKDGEAIMGAFGENDDSRNIYELLNSEILGKVSKTLQEMKEPRMQQMTDSSYIGLILHITIALDRIFKDEIIEQNEESSTKLHKDEDYELADKIISRLEEVFSIHIPEVEMDYVLLHIKGSKVNYTNSNHVGSEHMFESANLLDLVDQMIDEFDLEIAWELKCDEEFIQGLLIHLEPTLIRLQNDFAIYNPLLSEIKSEYHSVFEKCKKASNVIQKQLGFQVNEEEIGYLTMHFGAAVERVNNRKNSYRAVEIGIICASGFGLARLMMTKLKNALKQEVILKAYGKDEITPFVKSKTDFFISSMNLEHVEIDYVRVSPLFNAKDLQVIQMKINEYAHMPAKAQESDFTRQLDEINITINQIKNLIKIYRNIRIPEAITLDGMLSLISKQVTESLQNAALLKAELLDRENVMSQIFPEVGFALFHCRTKAVKEAAFYTCTPEKGPAFTDPYMKQMKVAIILLMPQDAYQKNYSEMLGFISSSLIEDKDFLQTIFQGDEDGVRLKLQKILKKYFGEYLNIV